MVSSNCQEIGRNWILPTEYAILDFNIGLDKIESNLSHSLEWELLQTKACLRWITNLLSLIRLVNITWSRNKFSSSSVDLSSTVLEQE